MKNKKKAGIFGTSQRPRLSVFQSPKNMYAQIIDDVAGKTLVSASTYKVKDYGGNIAAAKVVGKTLVEKAKALGISKIVFDRGCKAYHGRVKALAEAVREGGLIF